jgi:hypothetical protein
VVELRRVEMSEAVWIAIIALLGAVLTPLVVEWYKRRRRRQTTAPRVNVSAPSPALRTESNTPQAPSLSEIPAESNTTQTPSAIPADSSTPQATGEKRATPPDEKDVEGYPDYMRLPEVAAGPRVLLPYDTPTVLKQEVRQAPPPRRISLAPDAFVGRWVRFQNGIVRGVREGIECYAVIIAHERENTGDDYVILTVPRTRRAELERLREGQRITYEGQIRKAEDDILELVRVEIADPAS